MSDVDREALAPLTEALHRAACFVDDNESCCWTREDEDHLGQCRDESGRWYRIGIEETILASDWLAQVKATARAEAWDEGYMAGWEDRHADEHDPLPAGEQRDTANPYRGGAQ